MRFGLATVVLLLSLGCSDSQSTPQSYERCSPGALCGLGTQCLAAPLSASPTPLLVCTYGCVSDTDCPGFSARCVLGTDGDAAVSRCLRDCESDQDCRSGTRCRRATTSRGTAAYCVPEEGTRSCTSAADCAPLAARCESNRCVWE